MFDFLNCGNACGNTQSQPQMRTKRYLAVDKFGYIKQYDQVTQQILSNLDLNITKIELSNYDTHSHECQITNSKFTDKEFPPNLASIGDFAGKEKNIKWQRISTLFPQAVLFQGSVVADDIIQGNVGDCYFLSSLASLATEKDSPVIKRLLTKHSVRDGIYSVIIKIQGVPKQILVDDYVPTYNGKLIFSKPKQNSNEAWVMVLEKAWAKIYKSYSNISGGYPHTVLQSFAEGPTFYYNLKRFQDSSKFNSMQKLINKLSNAHQKSFPMCTGSVDSIQIQQKFGLVPGHAYSLLGFYNLNSKGKVYLIKLRNPWGKVEWKGQFSDRDKAWKEISIQQQKRLGYTQNNNGVFFMRLQDYLKFFQSLDICHNIRGFFYNFHQYSSNKGRSSYFRFKVTNEEFIYITLHFDSSIKDSFKKGILICAKEQEDGGFTYVKSTSQTTFSSTTLTLQSKWKKGNYILYVKVEDEELLKAKTKFVLSTYSQSRIDLFLESQEGKAKLKQKRFMENTFFSHASNNRTQVSQGSDAWYSFQFLVDRSDFGYIALKPDSDPRRKIALEFYLSDFAQNIVLKKPFKGKKGLQVLGGKSGSSQILICRLRGQLKEGFRFPPKIKIKQSI